MDGTKINHEHSWEELYTAASGIMNSINIERDRAEIDFITDLLITHFNLSQIEFLQQQVNNTAPQHRHLYNEVLGSWTKGHRRPEEISSEQLIAHIICLSAVIISSIHALEEDEYGFNYSNGSQITNTALKAVKEFDACKPRQYSNNVLTESDVARIRGETIEFMVQMDEEGNFITPRCCDNEHYAWMGNHLEEVRTMLPLLRERNSVAPELVQSLRTSNQPLADGTL